MSSSNSVPMDCASSNMERMSVSMVIPFSTQPTGRKGSGWPAPWSGWCMLLQCFNKRDLKALLKGAYRKTGNEILAIARQRLMSSGIAHASKLKRGIRLRVYPRGGGFMITVKPHGKQGCHVNRFGLEKPVLMWAEEGTKERMIWHLMSDGKRVVRIDEKFYRTAIFCKSFHSEWETLFDYCKKTIKLQFKL